MCLFEKVVFSVVASDKNTQAVIVSKFNYGCVNRIGGVGSNLRVLKTNKTQKTCDELVRFSSDLFFTAAYNNTSERVCPPGADPGLLGVSKESHEIL